MQMEVSYMGIILMKSSDADILYNHDKKSESVSDVVEKFPTDEKDYQKCFLCVKICI